MGQPLWAVELLSKSGHQAAGECGRAFHRDLLAENRAYGQFKTVPKTRHTQPGLHSNDGREHGVASKRLHDRGPIGVEIKHPPDAFRDDEEQLRIAKFNPCYQPVPLVVRANFKIAVLSVW